jgi:putative transposase
MRWLAERVTRALDQIIEWRGKPSRLRCDNEPENASGTLGYWAKKRGGQLDCILPGKSQQNACVERHNRTVELNSWG